jgi:type I restriction enzyme R subunit
MESELKAALPRLNPKIALRNELADEAIYKLRAILLSINQVGLVKANEEFFLWMQGEKTMLFGENNRHVPIHLIEFESNELINNAYIITYQYRVKNHYVRNY